jgi:hypothetical protein
LWHCARSIDWQINCEIRGVPEVADQPRWKDRLSLDAWFGYEVSLETACRVAATVSRSDVIEYAGEVKANIAPWLEALSEDQLDALPDLESNYRSNGTYVDVPRHEAWIKEDSDTPVWRMLAGACIGHVRGHVAEIRTLNQVLRKRAATV